MSLLLSLLMTVAASATEPDPNTWDLTEIFKTPADWQAALTAATKDVAKVSACRGHLGDSAKKLASCLELIVDLRKRGGLVSAWAGLKGSTDLRDPVNQENRQRVDNFWSNLGEQTSFFNNELIKVGRKKIQKFSAAEPRLKPYRQYLRMTFDQAEHLMPAAEEKLLAALGPLQTLGTNVHRQLLTSDIAWPSVKLANGGEVKIDVNGYEKNRSSANREDRQKVFKHFYATLARYESTFGTTLIDTVQRDVIMAKQRKWPDALSSALGDNAIPAAVYETLVKRVNDGLPLLHRYLEFQKQSLGIKDFAYHDIYVPLAPLEKRFTIDDTKALVLKALEPLGPDYQKHLRRGFDGRWMDVFPREGKAAGAFMQPGAYGVHPYVFLNHKDDFNSASTVAHEWGHAMHTLYSQETQPYQDSDYATFIAEIASTCNEVLLQEYLIKNAKDQKEKRFYLNNQIEGVRTTFFRQALFAEFELSAHREIEKGQPLSGRRLSEIYGGILRRYYGHDQGVMKIDEANFVEWAYVPHFYNSFYVYQYATSIAAGYYFADQILSGKPGAVENYLKVLKAGSSKYPYEILKNAGLDMAKGNAYDMILTRTEHALAELGK